MLLYENKKAIFLNFLKTEINPFEKFVSTGDTQESLGLVKSREKLLEVIIEIIENQKNFILPIIGDIGTGKTHLYWALKSKLYYFNTVHLSLDKVYKRFFYNTYSEFIETIELDPLRNVINQICSDWGSCEKKFGFFHVADIEKVKRNAFNALQNKFNENEKAALYDIITAITTHQLDPYKKVEAERWLLGELMNVRELSRLNLKYDLRKSKNAFIMLKLLIENSKMGTVFFVDDFDKIISIPKPIKDDEDDDDGEVFDRSWLFGKKQPTPDFPAQKIFNKIIKLQKIEDLRLLIALRSTDSLERVKRKINKLDKPLNLEILDPITLDNFKEEDIFEFYSQTMEIFLQNFNYSHFYEDFPHSFFPLNKNILKTVFKKAKGNPRDISKQLIKIFNKIQTSSESIEKILKDYQNLD